MSTVLNQVRQYEERQRRECAQQMSPQLVQFLETCWVFRKNVNLQNSDGKLDLYLLYCGRKHEMEDRPEGWTHGASQSIPRFFEGLSRIRSSFEMRIQPYGIVGDVLDEAEWNADDAKVLFARILNRAQRSPEIWGCVLWDLAMSFIHFLGDSAPAMRRVYLNVRPECRVTVCHFLATELAGVPEMVRFKVQGPLQKGHDTIVIYVTNDYGVTKLLKALADYQRLNKMYFDFPVIHLAKPATCNGKPLRGVAIATEPGNFEKVAPINKRNPSFGDFWERLLVPCLSDAKSEAMFFELVLRTMKQLRMDPKHPHKFMRK